MPKQIVDFLLCGSPKKTATCTF